MENTFWFLWSRGLFFSLICGHLITHFSNELIRYKYVKYKDPNERNGIPGWLIGFIERTFFTILVSCDVSWNCCSYASLDYFESDTKNKIFLLQYYL